MKRLPLLAADAPHRSVWLLVGGCLAAFATQCFLGLFIWVGCRVLGRPIEFSAFAAGLVSAMVVTVWSLALIQIWMQDPEFQTWTGVREVGLYSAGVVMAILSEALLLLPFVVVDIRIGLIAESIAAATAVGLVFRHAQRVVDE